MAVVAAADAALAPTISNASLPKFEALIVQLTEEAEEDTLACDASYASDSELCAMPSGTPRGRRRSLSDAFASSGSRGSSSSSLSAAAAEATATQKTPRVRVFRKQSGMAAASSETPPTPSRQRGAGLAVRTSIVRLPSGNLITPTGNLLDALDLDSSAAGSDRFFFHAVRRLSFSSLHPSPTAAAAACAAAAAPAKDVAADDIAASPPKAPQLPVVGAKAAQSQQSQSQPVAAPPPHRRPSTTVQQRAAAPHVPHSGAYWQPNAAPIQQQMQAHAHVAQAMAAAQHTGAAFQPGSPPSPSLSKEAAAAAAAIASTYQMQLHAAYWMQRAQHDAVVSVGGAFLPTVPLQHTQRAHAFGAASSWPLPRSPPHQHDLMGATALNGCGTAARMPEPEAPRRRRRRGSRAGAAVHARRAAREERLAWREERLARERTRTLARGEVPPPEAATSAKASIANNNGAAAKAVAHT